VALSLAYLAKRRPDRFPVGGEWKTLANVGGTWAAHKGVQGLTQPPLQQQSKNRLLFQRLQWQI
jgi:hypothetical protein